MYEQRQTLRDLPLLRLRRRPLCHSMKKGFVFQVIKTSLTSRSTKHPGLCTYDIQAILDFPSVAALSATHPSLQTHQLFPITIHSNQDDPRPQNRRPLQRARHQRHKSQRREPGPRKVLPVLLQTLQVGKTGLRVLLQGLRETPGPHRADQIRPLRTLYRDSGFHGAPVCPLRAACKWDRRW